MGFHPSSRVRWRGSITDQLKNFLLQITLTILDVRQLTILTRVVPTFDPRELCFTISTNHPTLRLLLLQRWLQFVWLFYQLRPRNWGTTNPLLWHRFHQSFEPIVPTFFTVVESV